MKVSSFKITTAIANSNDKPTYKTFLYLINTPYIEWLGILDCNTLGTNDIYAYLHSSFFHSSSAVWLIHFTVKCHTEIFE